MFIHEGWVAKTQFSSSIPKPLCLHKASIFTEEVTLQKAILPGGFLHWFITLDCKVCPALLSYVADLFAGGNGLPSAKKGCPVPFSPVTAPFCPYTYWENDPEYGLNKYDRILIPQLFTVSATSPALLFYPFPSTQLMRSGRPGTEGVILAWDYGTWKATPSLVPYKVTKVWFSSVVLRLCDISDLKGCLGRMVCMYNPSRSQEDQEFKASLGFIAN